MKKIFLLMTIMTSLFFALSIDSNAYTFNGSYDFSNVDLDASLSELNGASLNDLFNYDYFEHLYLAELPNGVRSKFELNNGNVVFKQYIQEYVLKDTDITNYQVVSNIDYIQIPTSKLNGLITQNISTIGNQIYIDGFTNEILQSQGNNTSSAYKFSTNATDILLFVPSGTYTNVTEAKAGLLDTKFYYELATPIIDTNIEQSLLFWNLENINIDLLNYYFAVWILNVFNLPVGDLWAYAWTAGNDSGYIDGFTDGQIAGYDDGYSDGNAFGYSDGFSDGQIDGYNTAVNDQLGAGDWLVEFIAGAVGVLGVTILPGVPLGLFVFIPLFFGLISFVYRLGGRKT